MASARLTIFFLLIFSLFFSCKKLEDSSAENIAHIPLSDEISTLDPISAYDTISANVMYQAYEPLFEYHYLKRPYTLQPLLADGMPTIENDGKRYIIKILPNIFYHPNPSLADDKRAVKAQDFINQIKRLAFAPSKSSGWWLFDDKIKGLNDFREKAKTLDDFVNLQVEGLKAKDDQTLIIELERPYPQLMSILAMSFTSPIPLESILFYKNDLSKNMIGTGPFILQSVENMNELTMTRNPRYRLATYPSEGDRQSHAHGHLKDAGRTIPFLDAVKFHVIKEAQLRWDKFNAKEIDVLVIPKDHYDAAIDGSGNLNKELEEQNIELQVFPTLTFWWLAFNMKDPVIGSNLNLRKAIAHALDQDLYIRLFTNNIAQKANSIYPPGIPGYDPSAQLPYEYNIEKAKKYLELAGYPGGEGLPILKYDVRGASATNREQAKFIKNELGKIGIKVETITNTFPGFLDKAREGKLQFWQDGWALDYPDAENVLQLLYSNNLPPGPNSTYFVNEEFDRLFERLKMIQDGEEKKQVMVRLEQIIHDELPWIMQHYARNYILIHSRLKNYRHSDLIFNTLKYLKIE